MVETNEASTGKSAIGFKGNNGKKSNAVAPFNQRIFFACSTLPFILLREQEMLMPLTTIKTTPSNISP